MWALIHSNSFWQTIFWISYKWAYLMNRNTSNSRTSGTRRIQIISNSQNIYPHKRRITFHSLRNPVKLTTNLFLPQMHWEMDALKKDPSVLPKKSSSLKILAIILQNLRILAMLVVLWFNLDLKKLNSTWFLSTNRKLILMFR